MEKVVIAVVSRKGGSGKTTTALHLAQTLAKAGHDVAVLDTDPEASAIQWADGAELAFPVYKPVERRRAEAHQYLIIDTQPNSSKAVGEAARKATHVIVVAGANALELDRLVPTLDSLEASGFEGTYGVLLARVPGAKSETTQAAIRALEEAEIPVLGVVPSNAVISDSFQQSPKRLKEHKEVLTRLQVLQ
ncbi:ParA family protein [Deinococcus cellulosilyticus]|uniref:CobQ/CobB/MinD/ParA nucleotide binding domain-containing protein n=1 Tax=Deinococcus cellulosilyticus (strain DSM 18568 / NBRC 106333 / KACC 11606 / 5516J-15) TaxID=1223518 RepID=A0A511NB86_DEIC1|nr:ParA family protein [Deinococcus cellulosilyticus]GEM49651.1 hypothetical protein DC3_52860 [Deinococcus cellulosilyticus NBRC 106333 = KACC 11606]